MRADTRVAGSSALDDVFEELFPSCVVGQAARSGDDKAALHPAEARALRNAVPKRQREFRRGRACAHRALAAMGIEDVGVPVGSDRAPVWPAGVVGSITHCDGFCGAAVARSAELGGIGFDAETAGDLPPEIRSLVGSEHEADQLARLNLPADAWKLLFSAKESFHKCYYPATGLTLEFLDVNVELRPSEGRFLLRLVRPDAPALFGRRDAVGRFVIRGGVVLTGVTSGSSRPAVLGVME